MATCDICDRKSACATDVPTVHGEATVCHACRGLELCDDAELCEACAWRAARRAATRPTATTLRLRWRYAGAHYERLLWPCPGLIAAIMLHTTPTVTVGVDTVTTAAALDAIWRAHRAANPTRTPDVTNLYIFDAIANLTAVDPTLPITVTLEPAAPTT